MRDAPLQGLSIETCREVLAHCPNVRCIWVNSDSPISGAYGLDKFCLLAPRIVLLGSFEDDELSWMHGPTERERFEEAWSSLTNLEALALCEDNVVQCSTSIAWPWCFAPWTVM